MYPERIILIPSSIGNDIKIPEKFNIFTSRVSGRGNKIGTVFLSVCLFALSQPNRFTYDLDFWYGTYVFMCVSQSSIRKGLWGIRDVQWGDAGGT